MRLFSRGMKWTGLLIMGLLVIVGANQSDKVNGFVNGIKSKVGL